MQANIIKTWHKMQVREEERRHDVQGKESERKIYNEIETLVKPVSISLSCIS